MDSKWIKKAKSGVGSELLTVAITLLTFLFIYGMVTISGQYDASVQAQIYADIINDGAVSYAQNDMNVSEIAYSKMAEKIFLANQDLANSTWCSIDTYSYQKPKLAKEDTSKFSEAEEKLITDRGEIKTGTLSTDSYDFFRTSGYFKNEKEIKETNKKVKYNVRYKGPIYMDQLMTISVTASFKIPLLGSSTKKTTQSTIFTTAKEPYNSRASKDADGTYYKMFVQLEDMAYACVTHSDEKNVPEYGSIQQNILLEARRHLGSGYWIPAKNTPWPRNVNWDGTCQPNSYSNNSYYNCWAFVNACFMPKYGGLENAQSNYANTSVSKKVVFKNEVSTEKIWEAMQPKEETVSLSYKLTPYSTAYRTYNNGFSIFNSLKKNYYESGNYIYYLSYNSTTKKHFKVILKKPNNAVITLNDLKRGSYTATTDPELTYAQAIAKYCGADKTKLFSVSSFKGWKLNELIPGDVLIFSDPNWRPRVASIISQIAKMEEPDYAKFAEWDNPKQSFVSHFAIYVGNGYMVHAANPATPSKDPYSQGVFITKVSGMTKKDLGDKTQVLSSVIRFDKNSGTHNVIHIEDIDAQYNK